MVRDSELQAEIMPVGHRKGRCRTLLSDVLALQLHLQVAPTALSSDSPGRLRSSNSLGSDVHSYVIGLFILQCLPSISDILQGVEKPCFKHMKKPGPAIINCGLVLNFPTRSLKSARGSTSHGSLVGGCPRLHTE